MVRSLFAVLILVQMLVGFARAQGEREYEPRLLSRTEIQMLQDALIWTSNYYGLKDGGWGRIAAEANREWRRANNLRQSETYTEAELEVLFRQALRARQAVGWTTIFDPYTGVWLGYPGRYVQPGDRKAPSAAVRATEFRGVDEAVSISALRNTLDLVEIRKVMAWFIEAEAVAKITYRLDRDYRQVLSADLRTGSSIYVRFDRYGAEWRGFFLRVQRDKVDVGRMIAATSAEFSPTGSSVVDDPANAPILGPIVARVAASSAVPRLTAPYAPIARFAPTPSPAALPSAAETASPVSLTPAATFPGQVPAQKLIGSGTSFAVRKDGLFLTNQHVVEGCTRVTLEDETPLDVVAADQRRDLALLRAKSLSTFETVRFRRDATIDLGEAVSLFGFPFYQAVSTGINLTNGIVTSLAGLGDNPMHFQVNAAMQPGNSGGPLLDESGLLIGVAVARLSDRLVMRETGVVPQVMNYAIRAPVADSFLLENGILAEKRPGQGRVDLRDVARLMQQAVRPVLCFR